MHTQSQSLISLLCREVPQWRLWAPPKCKIHLILAYMLRGDINTNKSSLTGFPLQVLTCRTPIEFQIINYQQCCHVSYESMRFSFLVEIILVSWDFLGENWGFPNMSFLWGNLLPIECWIACQISSYLFKYGWPRWTYKVIQVIKHQINII